MWQGRDTKSAFVFPGGHLEQSGTQLHQPIEPTGVSRMFCQGNWAKSTFGAHNASERTCQQMYVLKWKKKKLGDLTLKPNVLPDDGENSFRL